MGSKKNRVAAQRRRAAKKFRRQSREVPRMSASLAAAPHGGHSMLSCGCDAHEVMAGFEELMAFQRRQPHLDAVLHEILIGRGWSQEGGIGGRRMPGGEYLTQEYWAPAVDATDDDAGRYIEVVAELDPATGAVGGIHYETGGFGSLAFTPGCDYTNRDELIAALPSMDGAAAEMP